MNIIKIILILLGLVFVGILGSIVVGAAFSLLRLLFWLAVIGAVIAVLWKLFGGGDAPSPGAEKQGQLQNTELTLEEYKRKLESQLKEPRSGKDSS